MSVARGNPAVFNCTDSANLTALTIPFTPLQLGSGDPSPTNVRPIVGWNKIDIKHYKENAFTFSRTDAGTSNGVTFTPIKGSNNIVHSVYVKGQRTTINSFYNLNFINLTTLSISPGTYKASGFTDSVGIRVYIINAQSQEQNIFNSSSSTTFTVPSDAIASWARLQINTENAVDEIVTPVFVPSTDTVTDYSITIPENNFAYGGTVDAISGSLSINYVAYAFDGSESITKSSNVITGGVKFTTNIFDALDVATHSGISDKAVYESTYPSSISRLGVRITDGSYGTSFFVPNSLIATDATADQFKTWLASNPVTVCVKLITPIAVQLTGITIPTLAGKNTIVTSSNSVNVINYIKELSSKVSKVILGNNAWIDVTQDTVRPENLLEGYTATQANGERITGKLSTSFNVSGYTSENDHWVRPEGYPDLDVLFDTIDDNESCVYLTYDLTKTPGYGWIGVVANNATYYVERGHISNGAFVADYTSNAMSSATRFQQTLDSTNGNVQLWRVRSSGNLGYLKFCCNSDTNANNFHNNVQPCVERVGKLPYCNTLSSNPSTGYNNYCFGTKWLERDKLIVGTKAVVTSMGSMYTQCHSLIETNCGEWDTSNWTVTSISSMFDGCYKLRKLDLSKWDTSNWSVTTMSSAWNTCTSLEVLDVSTWDTTNWRPASFEYVFSNCASLKELDLSGWNVSNWTITSFRAAWQSCYNLRKLDVSTWDTSNWAITSFTAAWNGCNSLIYLDLSNWNTSNWRVTAMTSAWTSCCCLQKLDLNSWDVSNWTITSLESVWSNCRLLKELKISSWDVSDWVITSLSATWNGCYSLESLNLNSWDVSNWRITTMYSTWNSCVSLKELKIDQWEVDDWVVTDFSRTFYNCLSLEEIDLTSWDVSNWAVTTIYYLFYTMYNIKKIDIHNWDVSNWALTDTRYLYGANYAETLLFPEHLHGTAANSKYTVNSYYLVNFNGIAIDIAQNYSNATRLTRESLLSIISRLPTVGSTVTLTIGQTNKNKLTSAEIAVATQKGWTVA